MCRTGCTPCCDAGRFWLLLLMHIAELAIGNIVRRVLHMIREEQQQEQLSHSAGGTTATDAADQQQVCRGGAVNLLGRLLPLLCIPHFHQVCTVSGRPCKCQNTS